MTRKLPCRPMASTADGRDSAGVTAGLVSAGRVRARPLAPRIASIGCRAPKSKKFRIPGREGWGGIDSDIDILTYICIHKVYSSNFHIPVRAQAAAARAVHGRDLAGKRVHENDVLQDDDDEEEEVVVHKRQDRNRKR